MNAWQSDGVDDGAASPSPPPAATAPFAPLHERADSAPDPAKPGAGDDEPATVSIDRDRSAASVRWLAVGLMVVGVLGCSLWLARGDAASWQRAANLPSAAITPPPSSPDVQSSVLPAWLAGGSHETAPAASLPGAGQLLARAAANPGTPEARLLRVYALLASGHGEQALEEARRLAQDVPHFGLAQLAYADLLASRAAPLAGFAAVPAALSASLAASAAASAPPSSNVAASASPQSMREVAGAASAPQLADRVKDFSAEARARVTGAATAPPAGAIPAQFVFVAPTVRHAIAVDASRSRLYVFENTAGGLVLKRDFYASVGKLGTAKRIEGDLRTPLGVYFVTGRLSRARLADRYGASAMVLNYPNQYDLIRGRTGSGIWLHGVESTLFSRAPLATDGCVALSNNDLLALVQDVDRQATPVVIADRLNWLPAAQASKVPAGFSEAFSAWRATRQQADPAAEFALYANVHADAYASLLRPAASLAAAASVAGSASGASPTASGTVATTPANWIDVLRAERQRPGSAATQLIQQSVLAWHDRDDVMLVTYTETTSRDAGARVKRQYWLHRDGNWNIVFDGVVG